jgi:hypothetical protein
MPEIRPYGPGKFSSLLDSAIFMLAGEGVDEEMSDEGFGWAGLLRLGFGETLFHPELFPNVQLNADEQAYLEAQKAGAVLRETTDGHVTIEYFADPEDLAAAWKEAQDEFEPFAGNDEQMDGDPGDQDTHITADDIPLP